MEEDLNLNKNSELNKALLEFQIDNTKEGILNTSKKVIIDSSSKMVSWVMRIFNLEEEKYANYILVFFALIIFGFSFYLFFNNYNSQSGYPDDIKMIPAYGS